MLTRSHLALAMSVSAALLCGCGGTAESAQPTAGASSAAPAAEDRKQQFQAAKADCMKKQGFKYVPFVRPEMQWSEDDKARFAGDYQAMRKYREKYGFGIFAMHVYPKEMGSPAVEPDNPGPVNPNQAIQTSLSKAQHQAYMKAMDSCDITAANQALGLKLKQGVHILAQMNSAGRRAARATLNSDPELVKLATTMATCLKGKGYAISDTTPTSMSSHIQEEFSAQDDRLGREQLPDVPDVPPAGKQDETPMRYTPALTPEEARPYLNKEIKAALDDLECGKDFYPAYEPKSGAIGRQIEEQFAF